MQTKSILAVLFFISSIITANGQTYYTETNNRNKLVIPAPSFQVSVIPGNSTFFLTVSNPEKKRLQLRISHRDIGIVVDTTISSDFRQRYNMDEAADGRYTVEVSNGREKIAKELELNTVTTRNVVVH